MRFNNEVSHKRLLEVLDYNKNTGYFYWKVFRNQKSRIGDKAGLLSSEGYIRIKIDGVSYSAHRLAWLYIYEKWPEHILDHKNNIRTDNRIKNLREADFSKNTCNSNIRSDSSSGFKGINWDKDSGKWRARIWLQGKAIWSKRFDILEEAKIEIEKQRKILHKEFAKS